MLVKVVTQQKSTKPIYILNGPNLNLLGQRQPEIYGAETLSDIEARCQSHAKKLKLAIDFRQTNSEGTLIDWIQEAGQSGSALIINAAAYTHTSVGLHDALLAIDIPIIELHLSNTHKRENFRHKSHVSGAADGIIAGFGAGGYELALDALQHL